jgi:hypothetical protein
MPQVQSLLTSLGLELLNYFEVGNTKSVNKYGYTGLYNLSINGFGLGEVGGTQSSKFARQPCLMQNRC